MLRIIAKTIRKRNAARHPSKGRIAEFTKRMAYWMYPCLQDAPTWPITQKSLERRLARLLNGGNTYAQNEAKALSKEFFKHLIKVKVQLDADARFIAQNDPAATCVEEVITAYPGFYAILVYRMAHILAGLGVPFIPRIMTEHAHSLTGIDIHPKATIGSEFCIDHGTGIVIGESTIIGNQVKLYQGVTLGALSVSKDKASTKRHPTIGDRVIIYAGSTILGGSTVIGHDSIIGGNVWLTESVPPHSLVYHESKVIIKERKKVGYESN
jgi:serine O-acetyltransferase